MTGLRAAGRLECDQFEGDRRNEGEGDCRANVKARWDGGKKEWRSDRPRASNRVKTASADAQTADLDNVSANVRPRLVQC